MHICLNTSCFVVQWLSCVWLFASPWIVARQASLSLTISWSLPKFISIVLVMPSYHVILCCPLLLLPSVFPTNRVFSNESAVHIRWPKYWNCSFSISPSKDYSVLISFKIDWFGEKKIKKINWLVWSSCFPGYFQESSPAPQFEIINSSTLCLCCPALTSICNYWKTIALTIWTFVGKLMSLLFNILSRSVIGFLPRSRCLLISWLQSPSAVILESKKITKK